MPRFAHLTTLLLAALLLATACTDADTPENPTLRIIAAKHLWQTTACEPVPLYVVDWPAGKTRVGPTDRYITLALSPSGDRIAAAHADWPHCEDHENFEDSERTTSLALIDPVTFEVTELATREHSMDYLHWSLDGQYLAFASSYGLTVFDVEARVEIRTVELSSISFQNRQRIVGPPDGAFAFIFPQGRYWVGVPRAPAAELVFWQADCATPSSLSIERVKVTGPEQATIYYMCIDDSAPQHYRWEATIDLADGTLSPGIASPDQELWEQQFWDQIEQIEQDHPGARIWGIFGTDHTQQLRFLSVDHSPGGADVEASLRPPREGYPPDTESAIAIRMPDTTLIYVDIPLALGSISYPPNRGPIGPTGPLHDVAILPN